MSGNMSMKSSQISQGTINTQNTSIIGCESDIRIRWICSFLDGRTHVQFNDKSGLILHKGHECFSYFSKLGNKLRFMSKNIPCTESIEYKVNLVFRHLNQYNDVPTIKSEKLYSEEEEILNSQKISSCIWDLNSDINEFEIDEEGNISIISVEGHAKLTLLKNKFIFTVEYLQLIPKKRATWSNRLNPAEDEDDEDNDENNNTNKSLNQGEFDFHKDFLQKYNLKMQKKDNKNKGKIKLAYPYIRMKKLYTIFSYPERWTLPLFLLWSRLEKQEFSHLLGSEVSLVYHPQFKQDFLDYFNNDINSDSYDDIVFKNYIREKYGLNKINTSEAMTELPNIGMLREIQHQNITSDNLWSNDEVFPQFDQPRYSDQIFYIWKDDYSAWISDQNEVYLFNSHDSLFLFSTQNGKFYHEVVENNLKSIEEEEKVINVIQVWRDDDKSLLLSQFSKLRDHDVMIEDKDKTLNKLKEGNRFQKEGKENKEEKQENIVSLYSDNYEILHQCENEYGKFEAFKNGCIKILFRDRTILRWMKGSDKLNIISRYGDQVSVLVQSPQEFQEYADRALEFREYCFTDPKEKLEKERKQQELNDLIHFEINKNERFLTILKGQAPEEFRNAVNSNDQTIKQYNPASSMSSLASQNNDISYSTPMKNSNILPNANSLASSHQQGFYQSQDQQHQDMNEMIQNMLRQNEAMLQKLKQIV